MIEDLWRKQNAFGEVNNKPSLTEPVKTYSVYDYLRDPSIVLGSRKPIEGSASGYMDLSDPRNPKLVETQPFEDLPDSWDSELPRDPALYGAGDAPARTPRPSQAASKKAAQKAPQAKSSSTDQGADAGRLGGNAGDKDAAKEEEV